MKTAQWIGRIEAGAIERIAAIKFKPSFFIRVYQTPNTKPLGRIDKWSDMYVALQNPNPVAVEANFLFCE
jgi:hypothetical protein